MELLIFVFILLAAIVAAFITVFKIIKSVKPEGKDSRQMANRLKELEANLKELNREVESRSHNLAEHKKPAEGSQEQPLFEISREQKRMRIGEILLAYNFINKDTLDKALEYQEQHGRSITQYLLAFGFINEAQLAQCLCTQFGIPYLPLSSYDISEEIIKMVPVDIVAKYWLVPVEKRGDSLMVVMSDPLDTKAIKELEEITGCRVLPFVGIISEIIEALKVYYKIKIEEDDFQSKRTPPFFIDTKIYKGFERRQAIRFKVNIDIRVPFDGYYKKTRTKDFSRSGFLFESENHIPLGTLLTAEINLPKGFSPLPIATVAQVVRAIPLKSGRFDIGVKIIKISKQELNMIMEYASTHEED
ncbi:MAG: PilZ domain-containing protein [Candidatus Omnitrophota bacterium]